MLKRKNKLIPNIVGHVPREISQFICFFLTHAGKMEASVLSIQSLPSSIPSGGLEIMLKAKLIIDEKHAQILKYLQQLIAENCETCTDIETDQTGITDQQLEEKEDDIDEVFFIDDGTDNEEE